MKTARLTTMALAIGAALSLAGCSSAGKPGSLAVYGNLQTIEVAPVLLAADRIHQPPLMVRFGGIPNLVGDQSRSDRDPGIADLGTHAETQLLRYSLQYPDLRIIMTVAEGHYRIVARRSAGINAVADLAGKKVATVRPTSSGYFLHRMLQEAGLSYDDITVVPIREPRDVPGIMARGEADAAVIWEPHSENALKVLGDDHVEFDGQGVYREMFNLNTTAAVLGSPEKRRQVVEFVRSVILASRAITADPALAQPLVTRAGGFTEAEIEAAWRHHSFPASLPGHLLDTMVEEEAWLAAADGRTARSREQLSQLIDPSILAEAMKGL